MRRPTKLPKHVEAACLAPLLDSLGIAFRDTVRIDFQPGGVTVEYILRNHEGNPYINPYTKDAATQVIEVEWN